MIDFLHTESQYQMHADIYVDWISLIRAHYSKMQLKKLLEEAKLGWTEIFHTNLIEGYRKSETIFSKKMNSIARFSENPFIIFCSCNF